MGGDCVLYVCYVKVVVFYVALFDEVVCYSCDVVAMVDVCKFVYLAQTFFSYGVDDDSVSVLCCSGNVFNQGAEVEEVVVSFKFASCHFLLSFSDSTNFKHFRDASVAKQI